VAVKIQNKYIIFISLIFVLFSLSYIVLLEQTWMQGVTLNPFQIDEVELIKEGEPLYSQKGIRIHDKKFIRQVLRDIKGAHFIKETFPLDDNLIRGERYLLLARDGQLIKLHAEIYSGKNNGFNDEATMLVGDRYYYEVPNSIKQLFLLKPKEIAQKVGNADMWIHWNSLVVIEGQPFYQHFVGEKLNDIQFEEEFIIKKILPSPTIIPIYENPQSLLEEKVASIGPVGTVVYKADGMYFAKNEKESDNWSVLLPYGQSAHSLDLEPNGEVEFWSSYNTSYFIVRNGENNIIVLSAQDPGTPEGNLLQWDEDNRRFVSSSSSVTYSKTGEPSKIGFAPMQIFPSKVWNDTVFFSYY